MDHSGSKVLIIGVGFRESTFFQILQTLNLVHGEVGQESTPQSINTLRKGPATLNSKRRDSRKQLITLQPLGGLLPQVPHYLSSMGRTTPDRHRDPPSKDLWIARRKGPRNPKQERSSVVDVEDPLTA